MGIVPQVNREILLGTSALLPMALRSPDLIQMDFCLRYFMKGNIYVLPLPTTLRDLKTRIRDVCANIDNKKCPQRVVGG
jgi:hypothetical protein